MINSKIGFILIGIFLILDAVLIFSQGGYHYRGIWKEPTQSEAVINLFFGALCLYYGFSKRKQK